MRELDAVMLSGETSIGNHPEECIGFMKSIVAETENLKHLDMKIIYKKILIGSISAKPKDLAESIEAEGIIAVTRTGATATYIANAKPHGVPIFSFTNNEVT